MQNFGALGGPPPDPQNSPPHSEFLAIRLGALKTRPHFSQLAGEIQQQGSH